MSDRQPGAKLAGSERSVAEAGLCRRRNSDGDMPARREKRTLKLPRLEKPTAMQTSVIDRSVRTKSCFAFSICARERY